MKKTWISPQATRFGSFVEMTQASDQVNHGKCPGPGDDANCGPPGLVGHCTKEVRDEVCGGIGVVS